MSKFLDDSKSQFKTAFESLDTGLGAVAGIANAGLSGLKLAQVDTKGLENKIDASVNAMKMMGQQQPTASSLDGLMSQMASTNLLKGDYTKDDFNIGPSTGDIISGSLSGALSGATSGASAGGPIGAIIGGAVGLGSNIIGGLVGKNKANKAADEAYNRLRKQEQETNNLMQSQFQLTANNLNSQMNRNQFANVAAFGGYIQSNGMNNYNNIKEIAEGGSHGQNPYGGVPMGMDAQGVPNLVEQGEVIWNDYVFSNRLKVPKDLREKYKLKEDIKSFSDAAKLIRDSSKERMYNPIDRRTNDAILAEFQQAQELEKQKQEMKMMQKQMAASAPPNGGRMYSKGGKLGFDPNSYGFKPGKGFTLPVPSLGSVPPSFSSVDWNDPKSVQAELDRLNNLKIELPNNTESPNTYKADPLSFLRTKGIDSYLRYAPATMGLGAIVTDATGLTNKPDYSVANSVLDATKKYSNFPKVNAEKISDYMSYKPMDRMFYANQLGAQQAATRSGAMALGNGNRSSALASMLATDYANNVSMGQLYRQGMESNLDQREKVARFNQDTNKFNSELDLRAQQINANIERARLEMLMRSEITAATLKQEEELAAQQNKMTNIKNFFDTLGGLGEEAFNRYDRNALLKSGYGRMLNGGMKDRAANAYTWWDGNNKTTD